MQWKKLGLIFPSDTHDSCFVSHAALPIAEHLHNDRWRVYFSGRDDKGRAQIGYFDFNINAPYKILEVSQAPLIRFGSLGTFDDSGVTSSCLVHHDGKDYLYYSGWHLGKTVPFYFFIGLAIREKGNSHFKKYTEAPIMGRHPVDPYLLGSPSILIEDGLWRMWYVSAIGWKPYGEDVRHYYLIKYAESHDGIEWQRTNHICIDFESPDEYAIARPHVLKEDGIYRMWYSYRGDNYRMGYAESPDGLNWQRLDNQVGIDVSTTGWDSQMLTYPYIFDHQGIRYMLYNGNGYGKTGIGLAQLS